MLEPEDLAQDKVHHHTLQAETQDSVASVKSSLEYMWWYLPTTAMPSCPEAGRMTVKGQPGLKVRPCLSKEKLDHPTSGLRVSVSLEDPIKARKDPNNLSICPHHQTCALLSSS